MVSAENRTGLYISIPLYFVMLACVAVWGWLRTKALKKHADALSAHYLGGRSFGPLLAAGTMFASQFSGYTVVGIPNEAFATGWLALRWFLTGIGCVAGYAGTAYRLRKCSMMRNHQSPVDFITDRFRSQLLRYAILILQFTASIIYLSAQVSATKILFNSIFEIDEDSVVGVTIIFVVILLFEWTGGLVSVAATDGIQGIVMVVAFMLIPIVVAKNFGGWMSLSPETYPRPQFYQTPTQETQWLLWNFAVINIGFFSLPHMIQRTYAVKDLISLKYAYWSVAFGGFVAWLPAVFLGTMGVQILNDAGISKSKSAFADIMEQIMNLGPAGQAVGVISFTAALAAIMSTADSILIAISQMLTTELVYPVIPDASPTKITWIGRFVSLLITIVALVIGIFWKTGLTDLAKVQFGISLQCVPSFLVGLFAVDFTECHPWILAAGAISGGIITLGVYMGYIDNNPDAKAMDTGIVGVFCNIILVFLLESVRRIVTRDLTPSTTAVSVKRSNARKSIPVIKEEKDEDAGEDLTEKPIDIVSDDEDLKADVAKLEGAEDDDEEIYQVAYQLRPLWDFPKSTRFGERPLTADLIWKSMQGTWEPFTNPALVFLLIFMTTITVPIGPGSLPPLNEDGSWVYLPPVVRGIPYWAFMMIMLCVVIYSVLIVTIYALPNKFANEILDADIIEWLPKEMERRTTYDEKNKSVKLRRSEIRSSIISMKEIETPRIDELHRRRISELMSSEFSI